MLLLKFTFLAGVAFLVLDLTGTPFGLAAAFFLGAAFLAAAGAAAAPSAEGAAVLAAFGLAAVFFLVAVVFLAAGLASVAFLGACKQEARIQMGEPNTKGGKSTSYRESQGSGRWMDIKRLLWKGRNAYRFLLGGFLERIAKLVGVLAGWLDKLA